MAVDGNTRYMRNIAALLAPNAQRPRREAAIAADQTNAQVAVALNEPDAVYGLLSCWRVMIKN